MRNDRTGGIVSRNRFPTLLVFYILFTVGTLFMLNREVSAMSQVSCLVLIVAGIFLHIDDLICLIAAILPTGNVFMLGGGNTAIPFLLLIYIMKSIIRCRGRIDIDAMRPLLWSMLLLAISIITTTLHSVSIMKIIPFYMHIVFIVFALRVNHINDESMYRKMSLYFVAGTLLVCAGTVFFPRVSRALGNASVYLQENAGFSSTWDFGRSLTVSIAFVAVDMIKTKKRIVLDIALVLILMFFVVQSGRFSMLIGLGAIIVCLPFVSGRDKPLKQKVPYTVLMLVAVAVAAYALYKLVYTPMTKLRGIEASDNGRFDIWEIYFDYLNKNLSIVLFGVGGGAVSSFADMLGTATAHNIILEKTVEVGIVGLFLFIMYFLSLYRNMNLNPFRNENVLPLVAFLGTALTQGTSGNVAFALLLAMCATDVSDRGDNIIVQQSIKC